MVCKPCQTRGGLLSFLLSENISCFGSVQVVLQLWTGLEAEAVWPRGVAEAEAVRPRGVTREARGCRRPVVCGQGRVTCFPE